MPIPCRTARQIGDLRYQILDRRLAETTTADVKYAVISVTGSEQEFVRVPESPNRLGILTIKFDDIQTDIDGLVLFNSAHARMILNFFQEMLGLGMKLIIINCEKGLCRSAAIGAAIVELRGGRSVWFDRRFAPNAYVRQVMLEEGRRGMAADIHSKPQNAQNP